MYNSGKDKSSKTAIKESIQRFFFKGSKFRRQDTTKAMIFNLKEPVVGGRSLHKQLPNGKLV